MRTPPHITLIVLMCVTHSRVVVVTAKLDNTSNMSRSTESLLICCETATIFSIDSSLCARAVALAAEQPRPEAGAGPGLRDSALIGEGEPLGLLPPSVPSFPQFGKIGRASWRERVSQAV